ncbi:unnamed protein product [Eruca vesicaria subsp. sativa]|uniref:Transmembrane protein n=1 Tax=Eruca vesicaria subsp. sativa TaxID=29727 RepID=A0ABC8M7N9_ERUVS|nr:unnamed protein product [Eruca vesicaria subsp. sativa]
MVVVYFSLPLFIFMVFLAISGCVGCFYMGKHQAITKVGGPEMPTAYPTAPQVNQGYNTGAQPCPPNYAV